MSPYQIFSLCVNFEFSFLNKLELEDIDILHGTGTQLSKIKSLSYIFDCVGITNVENRQVQEIATLIFDSCRVSNET